MLDKRRLLLSTVAVVLVLAVYVVLREPAPRSASPSPAAMPPPAAAPAEVSRDTLSPVIESHWGEIGACVERESAARPNLAGKVVLAFEIGADGRVVESRTTDTTGSPTLSACIDAAIRTWVFPPPANGRTFSVHYPFELERKP